MMIRVSVLAASFVSVFCPTASAWQADLILHGGKIVTVDDRFSVAQAIAVEGDSIVKLGSDAEILALRGPKTQTVDLRGKMVLPGLIDSHTHPTGASMFEFDHAVPVMETIPDVLAYVRRRAAALSAGEWIVLQQVFITRLREQRYPTRMELDEAAPENPVLFRTGPDASLNTLALRESGIDKDFKITDGGAGRVERDPKTGEPTGILRNCSRFVKVRKSGRQPSDEDRYLRLRELLADYNSVGITGIIDRNASANAMKLYQRLLDADRLSVRVAASRGVGTLGSVQEVQERIRKVADEPLCDGGPMLDIIGIKVFLDGGMLTGSAYMRKPWGLSKIYSIDDPKYRGLLFIPPDRLERIARTAIEEGLQFTAHSVGDGAVHALIDAYGKIAETTPIRSTRPCVTHSNFMSREAVEKAAKLGVALDIQPAWLYLDTRTLTSQFGYDRLRWFQPLRSIFEAGGIVGGGSDHMQKIGSLRSVNPYNPFLGMWVTLTRRARWYDGQLHPEETLSREQAIRFYTRNNAYLMFKEDRIGSLEPGKFADFILLDRDLLTCPLDDIRDAKVLATYLAGKKVYAAK